MALQNMAAHAVRPRRPWRLAVVTTAVLLAAGCGPARQSYRPIYTVPAPVSTPPCTNCGTGSAVTPVNPDGSTTSEVPVIPNSSPSDLPAAPTNPPAKSSPGARAGTTIESVPKSRLSDEPPFDPTASPSPGGSRSTTPPPAPVPVNPSQGPGLNGPAATLLTPTDSTRDRLSAVYPKRVRRASLSQRLQPFLDEDNANELFYPNKADRPWKYIVLHHSAAASGNYAQIDDQHRKVLGYDGCGYHFVIGNGNGSKDGQIEVAARWNNQKQGAHCRNARTNDADEYGIGIVLVGDFDKQQPSPQQIAAAKALVAYLSQRYRIAPNGIKTHAHMAATPTVCPGKYFPSESLLAAAEGENDPNPRPVRSAWKVVRRAD
jgi:N-acetyl-anhydromuramyl-L-alanine amidase AmpD